MFEIHPLQVLTKKWKSILVTGLIFSLLCVALSLLFPLEYRADAGVYIISKSRYGVDPYTVVKSAEQVGQNITQVLKTQDFFDKVVQKAGPSLDLTTFQNISDRSKMKRWEKTVDGAVVFGTGVLKISTFSRSPEQARVLSTAVVDTLVEKGYEYVGGDVTIKVVNKPIVTRFPVRPNLPVNFLLGFFIGVLGMSTIHISKSRKLF